jgi:hypothetical protein
VDRQLSGPGGRGIDQDSLAVYRRSLEQHAIPFFGHTPLQNIDRDRIEAFITALFAKGFTPATVKRHLAPVQRMLRQAAEPGHISSNPATCLEINAKAGNVKRDDRGKHLSHAELLALLAAVPEGTRERDLFELMAWTGPRIGEALGLRPEGFTFGGSHVHGSMLLDAGNSPRPWPTGWVTTCRRSSGPTRTRSGGPRSGLTSAATRRPRAGSARRRLGKQFGIRGRSGAGGAGDRNGRKSGDRPWLQALRKK